jgi:hypothetical protein
MNMKNLSPIIITVLLGVFAISCSKSQPKQATPSQPKITDLGIVELSNHESHTYDLGNGKDCVVTFASTPQRTIDIHFVIQAKDANGNTQEIAMPRIITFPGNAVSASVGDIGIKLTPQLKTN